MPGSRSVRMAVDDDVRHGRAARRRPARRAARPAARPSRRGARRRSRSRWRARPRRRRRACPSARRAPDRRRAAAGCTRRRGAAAARRRRPGRRACGRSWSARRRRTAAKSTGSAPTACTASVWNGTPNSCAIAASSAIGCTVPTSLLAHITLTTAAASGSAASASRSVVGRDPAVLVDRQPDDLGALVRGRATRRSRAPRGARSRWRSPGCGADPAARRAQ